MKRVLLIIIAGVYFAGCSTMDMGMVTSAGAKLAQAASISDSEINSSVSQYIAALDAPNVILTGNDPYAQRLSRITAPINKLDVLNIKVYKQN